MMTKMTMMIVVHLTVPLVAAHHLTVPLVAAHHLTVPLVAAHHLTVPLVAAHQVNLQVQRRIQALRIKILAVLRQVVALAVAHLEEMV
jgi:hypothetical protein